VDVGLRYIVSQSASQPVSQEVYLVLVLPQELGGGLVRPALRHTRSSHQLSSYHPGAGPGDGEMEQRCVSLGQRYSATGRKVWGTVASFN